MRISRILLYILAPFMLLALPSDTLVAISPYAPVPKEVPIYPQHVGNDESRFNALQRQITDEENRRRSDDQETRTRLSDHDRLLGGLIVDARVVAERTTKIEDRMFYVVGLLLALFLSSVWNNLMTRRIHTHLKNGKDKANGDH